LKNSKATNHTTMHFIMLIPQPSKLGWSISDHSTMIGKLDA
jgi:hypothetical protein